MHPILNSQLQRQTKISVAQTRGIKRKQISTDKQTGLYTANRSSGNDIRQELQGILIKSETNFIFGKMAIIGRNSIRGKFVHWGSRLHMRKLRSHGQDHQDSTDRASVVGGEARRVGITCIQLIAQPILFQVEIVRLGMLEEDLNQEIGNVRRRKTGEGSRDGR